jgi:two-component system LytT family response regulator
MPVSTIIIDDEAAARSRLRQFVSADARLQLVDEASNGLEAIEKIEAQQPQLIFLDIQMPGMDGFDVLRQLSTEHMPAVIFVTAYDQYALQAFDVSAVDYLLKPYSEGRLAEAVARVIAKIDRQSSNEIDQMLEQLPAKQYAHQLPVRINKRIKLLNVDEISRIVSEHRLINVYDRAGKRYWTNETLDQLNKRLDPSIFMRIHRSSLVNLQAGIEVEPWDDGRLKIHFLDGEVLIAAREPAKELRGRLGL